MPLIGSFNRFLIYRKIKIIVLDKDNIDEHVGMLENVLNLFMKLYSATVENGGRDISIRLPNLIFLHMRFLISKGKYP